MSTREDLRRFYALEINHSSLGLSPWKDPHQRYFCTPEGAEIFSGPGVDGIHYVLLPEDERVFCVAPMAEESTYVLPVAEDFQEFLSFLLFCRDESPLAQLWRLNESEFRRLLEENAQNRWPGCEETLAAQSAALTAITETFGSNPQDPFFKIKELHRAFDPADLVFSDEYYDVLGLENPRNTTSPKPETYYVLSASIRMKTGEERP